MNFTDPSQVVSVCWQMRQADYVRGRNRARINALFNGQPPYAPDEAKENNIEVNVNFLESTVLGHDARSQFNQAFQKPGNYFTCTTDAGAIHKRADRGKIVTKHINRILKRSLPYFEHMRGKFAGLVLHGIGPSVWQNADGAIPTGIGVEDLLVPANTRVTFDNLPFFTLLRSYTAPELIRLARSARRDPGWNQRLVTACLKWVDKESMALIGSNFPEIWSPEKVEERLKGDGVFYSGDQVPTIDVFDFWFYSDEGKKCGWRRRIVLDDWSSPSGTNVMVRNPELNFGANKWLYNSGDRVYASNWQEILSVQFADLSAVAPFRYHSVRSLGQLVYAVCHLQNRLRCRFTEAVFENLLMYFRVKGNEDAQRALQVNLINRGILEDTISFIPKEERWNPDKELAMLGLRENSGIISRNSSSYTSNLTQNATDRTEKTKFQVMAELQSATQLVSASLQQAYFYQTFEYRETFRRFTKKRSDDPLVNMFQARCLRDGVPETLLYNPEAWEIEAERIMGGGNKTLEMAIAQQLLEMRNLYDPEAQRQILRDVTLAITDDPARADQLVPDAPEISNAIHDAQLRFGTLMQGGKVDPKSGVNHIEVIEALLTNMALAVARIQKTTNVGTQEQIMGLANVGQHVASEIQMLAQDKNEMQRVKQYGDELGRLMNLIKGFAQRLQKKMQEQNGNSGVDPETLAKIKAMIIQAEAKAANTRESHAQRTAQREIQFEMEEQRKQSEFEQQMQRDNVETAHELRTDAVRTGHEIATEKLKAENAPAPAKEKAS